MVTEDVPWHQQTFDDVYRKITSGERPPIQGIRIQHNHTLPDDIRVVILEIIVNGWLQKPEDRPEMRLINDRLHRLTNRVLDNDPDRTLS